LVEKKLRKEISEAEKRKMLEPTIIGAIFTNVYRLLQKLTQTNDLFSINNLGLFSCQES